MALTEEQTRRYARNILMRELGPEGQEKLLASRVLVIGAGGLGSPAALYLAAAGVGHIGIADSDKVELSNLQRQLLHGTGDIGRPKVFSAADSLSRLNPELKVEAHPVFVDEDNIGALIAHYDFVLECTDNFSTKFLINDACVRAGKPFCHGSVLRFFGQVMTWVPGQGPCYRCMFREPPPESAATCASQAGVFGAVCGVIGSLQAMEAAKYLLGVGELLTGTLLSFDGLDMEFQRISFPECDPDCPACGRGSALQTV